ncbi:hypothetical protein [Trichocoleus sp. FACHB-591]|uniref:hypothetical protein n=1 Tax=Trichocoleus sp. FACHB-591 TaxID=2692872 RepID=UPI0018F01C0A|nr:hypothetical protein [Trichocoleus sp. FACHB-591]
MLLRHFLDNFVDEVIEPTWEYSNLAFYLPHLMTSRLQTAKLLLPFAIALAGTAPTLPLAPPVAAQGVQVIAQSPQSEIQETVIEYLRRPGLPDPTVKRIMVQGQYALASWLMGEGGGLVAVVNQDGVWQVRQVGGGMPSAEAISQRAQIPLQVSRSLLKRYTASSQAPVSQGTELPMTISRAEEVLAITVPDQNTTRSAYGGKLRLYDVHIAKMFEITHFLCQRDSIRGEQFWVYRAGGGSIDMGRFTISCSLSADIAAAYGLGKVERTDIRVSYEGGGGETQTYQVPILNITGGKVARWMSFTQKFRPSI